MAKKEEEPLHIDLAEQNGAAQREAKVSNKNVPVFEGKAYFFYLYQVMEMAKRFGGAKQKCLQRIRSQVAIAIVGYHGRTKLFLQVQSSHGEIKGIVRRKGGSRRKWRHSGRTKWKGKI